MNSAVFFTIFTLSTEELHMRRLIITVAVLTLFLIPTSAMSSGQACITVDGKNVELPVAAYSINGTVMVPGEAVFGNIGEVRWNPVSKKMYISKGNTEITIYAYSDYIAVNQERVRSPAPAVIINDMLMVPARFIAESLGIYTGWDADNNIVILDTTRRPEVRGILSISRAQAAKYPIVIIDPGHGGKESGATYGGIAEKTLNLDIAKRLKNILDESGVKNVITRTDDSYISLYSRSGLANKYNAGVLVSIHNNAQPGSSKTSGTMTLYYPSVSKTKGGLSSKEFATIVQNQLVNDLGTKNMGIIPRPGLAVLRTARMPAIIAEIGYMTNTAERNKLMQPEYRQKAAEALAKAVVKALDKI